MCERCACFKLERMNKEEIQKQIEAVRGLVKGLELLEKAIDDAGGYGECMVELDTIEQYTKDLTQTLQPYLNGEKLEV